MGWVEVDADSDYLGDPSSMGVLDFTLGYRFGVGEAQSVTTEVHYGIGDIDGFEIFDSPDDKVSKYYGVNLRGQWQFNNSFYLFVAPTYTKIELEAVTKVPGGCGFIPYQCYRTFREDDWEFNQSNVDLWSVELASGELERLTDRVGPDAAPVYSPDGSMIKGGP